MLPLPLSASRPASPRGEFSDLTTQLWVKVTGRRFPLDQVPWLAGPVGNPAGIGSDYFDELAGAKGWTVRRGGPARGLLPDFGALAGPTFPAARVHRAVTDFYERTSAYDLEAWSEWCGLFRPFGALLAIMFSRRLQQLNVPLSPLDTSLGTTSEVLQLVDPDTGAVRLTAWVRHLRRTGHVLYAGSYSVCRVPGYPEPCVKVVFPLPNGNAIVLMRPEVDDQGALTVTSAGRRFGDPGFYFTVSAGSGDIWARYVRSLRESIRVYPDVDAGVRADHVLSLWGATFLRLHYRLRQRPEEAGGAGR